MKKNENDEKQKKLFQLLRKLSSVQTENMIVSFGNHARKMKKAAKDNVSRVTEEVKDGAKRFGRGAQKLAEDYVAGKKGKTAIKEYEAKIAELEAEYEEGIKGIREEIARLEAQETEQTLELNDISQKRNRAFKEATEIYDSLEPARKEVERLRTLKADLQSGGQKSDANSSLSNRIDELKRQLEETKEKRKLAIDNDDKKADSQGKRKQIRLNRQLRRYTRTFNKMTSKENKKLEEEIAKVDAEIETAMETVKALYTRHNEAYEKHFTLCMQWNKMRENIDNTRTQINEHKAKENQYEIDAQEILEHIDTNKNLADEEKAMMPKQNAFQNMFGFIVNKFNGAAKFTSNVIGPIGRATKRIVTEEIPKAGKAVGRATKRIVTEEVPKAGKAVGNVGRQTINVIANKYQEIKGNLISKAEAKLEAELAKNQELKATRAEQKGINPDKESDENEGPEV